MAKQVPGDNQGLAPLNDSDVAAMTDSGSFSRGRTYFRRGYIHDTVIQGNAIEARCEGSGYEPYVVKATLHTEGQRGANPSSYSCTRPRGGFCKHIVALLLTWIDNPDSFARLTDLEAILANRSSDDLIAIVKEMVARHPDLRSLIELKFPPAASPNTSTVNVEALRRDAGRAMQRMAEREEEQDWESEYEPPLEFIHLLDLARRWATEDYWANVQTVCSVLLKEVEKGAGSLSYINDTVADLTSGCLLLLTDALDVQSDLPEADRFPPESRLALFRTLFEFWQFDLYRRDSSEMGYEVPEIICRHATGDERQEIESWIAELPEPTDGSGRGHQRADVPKVPRSRHVAAGIRHAHRIGPPRRSNVHGPPSPANLSGDSERHERHRRARPRLEGPGYPGHRGFRLGSRRQAAPPRRQTQGLAQSPARNHVTRKGPQTSRRHSTSQRRHLSQYSITLARPFSHLSAFGDEKNAPDTIQRASSYIPPGGQRYGLGPISSLTGAGVNPARYSSTSA